MTPAQLAAQLATRAEAVLHTLFPQGRRVGHEFVVGGLDGDAGDSLKVRMIGDKVGVGADFATGETFGDLLDVWRAARGLSLPAAMAEAASYLGVTLDASASRPQKTYRRPNRPDTVRKLDPDGPVMAYLRSRGLTAVTLTAFQIAEQPGAIKFPRLANNPGTLVFPYLRDGELLNCKYLALARPDGKKQTLQEGGAEPCLFGWPTIPDEARSVVLTEGEIDAMTLYQQGIPALSVPMGGGGGNKQDWIESDYDHLQRFDVIYLGLDMDAPGQDAVKEIVRRLGAERCRRVEWEHKDPNDCLQHGWKAADFQKCVRAAKTLDPEELKPADAYTGAVLHEFYPAPDEPVGVATPWQKVGDNLRFRHSEVTVWVGWNGHGKSLVLNHLAAASLARGDRWCIASMEMLPFRTLWRLVRQLTGQEKPTVEYIKTAMTWLGDKLWLFDLLGTAKLNRMLEVFAYAARRYEIRQFVVDSLAKCGLAEDDYNGQKAVLERLTEFAHQYQSHVHLVCHARKGADEHTPPGKMDVKGTGAITDLADNVVTVWRNKRKEEKRAEAEANGGLLDPQQADKPDASLLVSKQRHTGWEGDIWLWYDAPSMQYLERADHTARAYLEFSTHGRWQ